ncbi:LPS biosynthesis [Kaistia sp. 32K]|uniref:glycosyltransferase family 2 protein n=1 Tax=Kaistia sp. 32K TaxID=2795690 RepID=UPI00191659FD|nr:glycosyltransferase family 2 protein [Kaistia sp. 32K]BCP54572.1 LPS biosynthesis [Kaistia sp. 32K]
MPANTDRPRLSAVIITKNEARDLPTCLASLTFCDEIVIVDSGSTDGTIEIAERMASRTLVRTDWEGFGRQKQRALDAATGDWVLSIDADELIPPELALEIRAAIESGTHAGYRLHRLNYFLDKPLRHGGWYPDCHLRLVRRDTARFSENVVHEVLLVDGTIGELRTPMPHMSYHDFDEVLEKLRRYALAGAEQRRNSGRGGSPGKAIGHAIATFVKAYIGKRGFLDGRHGFAAAAASAQEIFWRYLIAGWPR